MPYPSQPLILFQRPPAFFRIWLKDTRIVHRPSRIDVQTLFLLLLPRIPIPGNDFLRCSLPYQVRHGL